MSPTFDAFGRPTRPRLFVSYHHANDRGAFDEFCRVFCDHYGFFSDKSLRQELVRSTDSDYVKRRIREEHIGGSSGTVVLCGPGTPGRRFVDWEISATLDAKHALLGVILPSTPAENGYYRIPDRLYDNIQSGYAHWVHWSVLAADHSWLERAVSTAIERARNTRRIQNDRPLLRRRF